METVYFNGGSLISKRSSIIEAAKCGCCRVLETDVDEIEGCSDAKSMGKPPKGGCNYSFQPYAYPRSALSDWERVMCKATIEDYQRHFNLKIGVYVQGKNMLCIHSAV